MSLRGPSRRFAAVQHAVGFQTYRVGVLISFSDFPLSGVFRALTRRAEIVEIDPLLSSTARLDWTLGTALDQIATQLVPHLGRSVAMLCMHVGCSDR